MSWRSERCRSRNRNRPCVIEVKAFGLNHAELHMRKGEWAEIADVSGIECVGIVKSCPGGEFPVGAKVAALMGGLGRTINGSYAEYTRAPFRTSPSSKRICPGPCSQRSPRPMHRLDLPVPQPRDQRGQLLVLRGATSSFGQAALKMAVNAGVRVIATTRNRERFAMLEKLGPSGRDRSAGSVEAYPGGEENRCGARPGGQQRHARFAGDAPPRRPFLPGRLARRARSRSPTSTRCCKWRAAST